MIIEGYQFNPFPFEIGDILRDKEDGALAELILVNYHHVGLRYLTGEFAGIPYLTHRTLETTYDFERVEEKC